MDTPLMDASSNQATDLTDHDSEESENFNATETAPNISAEAPEDTQSKVSDSEEIVIKQEDKSDNEISESNSVDDNVETENTENEKLPNENLESANLPGSETLPESESLPESENIAESENSCESENINNGIIENLDTSTSKGRKRKASETHSDEEKHDENEQEKRPKNDLDASLLTEIKEEPCFNEADLNLPPKQTFGKGKRARIPNKRYSDISLSYKNANKSFENGSERIESENESMEISIKEEPLSPVVNSPKPKEKVDTPVQVTKKKVVDLSDPKYLKPFKYGWRRELVWRGTHEPNKRMGDIYYYSPQGKKVRSMREVSEILKNKELSLDNFSYFKAPLGLNDPEKETVRDAKKINPHSALMKKALTKSSPKSPKLPPTTNETDKISSPKLASVKVLSPKISSPKILSPKLSTPKVSSPKIASPKLASLRVASPKITSPKIASPKVLSPKISSPKIRSPKVANQKNTGSKATTPKVTPRLARGTRAKVVSPKAPSPKALSPKKVTTESVETPAKTRAAAKGTQKIKVPPKKDKRAIKLEEAMEVYSPPPPPPKPTTPKPAPPKKGRWAKAAATSPVKPKKRTIKLSSITNSEEKEENKFMDNYLQNVSYGYNTLLYVFQYLKVQDLLRAGCVCTMWRDIASHPMLWRTVRMKNSQVHSFEGLAYSLKKYGTRHLDLRKMLLPSGGGDEIWPEFSKAIEKVDTLRKIELCRCPASVVEKLALSNPQLEVINAVTIKCENMDLEPLKALTNVRELRLKSTGGLTLKSSLDSLKDMKELRHLSLTSIRDLDRMNLSVIAELTKLESLDLGECTDFPKTFGSEILVKLDKLEKLRLEKGQGVCHTFEILDAVKDMNRLEQLELVNFDIKAGFDKALGVCQNIKKLLIIPTYISQSATTNHMVLGGVLRLQRTLSHFVWGVTLELLRVTELFVDQCEEPDKKEKRDKKVAGNGDSIPVLKPVPLLIDRDNEIPPAHDPPQVEILALPSLQKLLMQNLPTTRVKILKIPFHATWRQSITDSVN